MKEKLHAALDILHRIFSSRYVLYLESEVKRLRDENRQILYRLANLPAQVAVPAQSGSPNGAGATTRGAVPKIRRNPSWWQANKQKEAAAANSNKTFIEKENQRVVAETQERAEQEKKEAMSAFD